MAVVAAFAQWLHERLQQPHHLLASARDLRNAALRKIQTLPLSYLDAHPSGDIVSRMVADVDTVCGRPAHGLHPALHAAC